VVFPFASSRDRFLAGRDEERLADLQSAFDDPAIGAVWAIRGGYGTARLLDRLSLDRQRTDPIPFIGFSDNTAVHARHAELGVVSFHGPHPTGDISPAADAWFRRVLFLGEAPGALPRSPVGPAPRTLVDGQSEGRLVGGNLSILASLCGTRHALQAEGGVLFLEDVDEPAYRVDRMLLQLERSGGLDGVVGLACGRFTHEDGMPTDVDEVLAEYAERLGVPAVTGLPFGHVPENFVLPAGTRARLDADGAALTLLEPAVRPA
jgi:muramoyltetrapeptide carboxypeptidase